jgi:hypothetical protein
MRVFGQTHGWMGEPPHCGILQDQNEKVLQKLRESLTRVRTTAQKIQSAGDIAGGTSDRVHLMGTPEGRVSMQASGTFNSLGRGVLSPTGCTDARKFSCPNRTGAQGSTVMNTGGRDVKNTSICYKNRN